MEVVCLLWNNHSQKKMETRRLGLHFGFLSDLLAKLPDLSKPQFPHLWCQGLLINACFTMFWWRLNEIMCLSQCLISSLCPFLLDSKIHFAQLFLKLWGSPSLSPNIYLESWIKRSKYLSRIMSYTLKIKGRSSFVYSLLTVRCASSEKLCFMWYKSDS